MKISSKLSLAVVLALPAGLNAQQERLPLLGEQPAAQAAQAHAEPSARAEIFTGKIFTARGRVEYRKAGSPDWLPVKAPQAIDEGDRVRTGEKSLAELYLRHGVKVRLEAGSIFVLNSAAKENASLEVLAGKMQAWIRKLAGRRLSVRTPTAVCAIRGTVFEVEVAETGETAWNLFSGSLQVADISNANPVDLAPNQRVVVTKAEGVTAPVPLPAEIPVPVEPAKTREEKEEMKAEQQAAKAEEKAAAEKAKAEAKAEAEAKAKAEAEAKAKAEAEAKAKAEAEAKAEGQEQVEGESAAEPAAEEPPAVPEPEPNVIQTQEVQESVEVSGSTPGL